MGMALRLLQEVGKLGCAKVSLLTVGLLGSETYCGNGRLMLHPALGKSPCPC